MYYVLYYWSLRSITSLGVHGPSREGSWASPLWQGDYRGRGWSAPSDPDCLPDGAGVRHEREGRAGRLPERGGPLAAGQALQQRHCRGLVHISCFCLQIFTMLRWFYDQVMDEEVRAIVDEAYKRTLNLMEEKKVNTIIVKYSLLLTCLWRSKFVWWPSCWWRRRYRHWIIS